MKIRQTRTTFRTRKLKLQTQLRQGRPSPTNPTSDKPELSTEKQGPRILVVEDNKINLNLMLAFLKRRGLAALDSAENGKLAVSAVKEEQQGYDIIFMGKLSPFKLLN